ncbi:hypothetical protein BDB00DRAFT_848304 [Zychaea mexicana]|uniref:uncharacterized protein n=1 Tax=Zychaea mexicana TaxID=64656 RepID=UPI0022FF452D|nr:uncharacterized protein BDB00DRAFT_848304 [Zychaea mexicana]KAI9488408.1 hypothetical protein BDB00DRAFT_848304 [Zychaea mexicana]
MGFIEKLRAQYEMRKVNKYTKRRLSQSQFASHDRTYYDSVYRDGVYLDHGSSDSNLHVDNNNNNNNKSRWSLSDLLKRSQSISTGQNKSTSLAASQYKTSETYTLGITR